MSNDPKNKTKKQSSKPQSAVRSHYDQAGGCSYSHVISLGPRPKTNPSTDHCQYTGSMQYMCRMRSGDKTNVICLALFPGHVGTRLGICAVEQLYIHLYKINCLGVCSMAHAMWTVSKWARACIYVSRWYRGNINNSY